MSINLTGKQSDISFHTSEGKPIFSGTIPPEMHIYIIWLSSYGYTDVQIAEILNKSMEGKT